MDRHLLAGNFPAVLCHVWWLQKRKKIRRVRGPVLDHAHISRRAKERFVGDGSAPETTSSGSERKGKSGALVFATGAAFPAMNNNDNLQPPLDNADAAAAVDNQEGQHWNWADEVSSMERRLTELHDHLHELDAMLRNMKNDLVTHMDEFFRLNMALLKERREIAWARAMLQGYASQPDVGPAHRDAAASVEDAEEQDAGSGSLPPLVRSLSTNDSESEGGVNEVDLNDVD